MTDLDGVKTLNPPSGKGLRVTDLLTQTDLVAIDIAIAALALLTEASADLGTSIDRLTKEDLTRWMKSKA